MAKRKTAAKPKSTARKSTRSASPKTKSSAKKPKSKTLAKVKKSNPDAAEVTIDRRRTARREDEDQSNAASGSNALPIQLERRKKVNRRRQIDPTTCERDYTDEEIQFMNAMDDYKRASGRMFPTCSEVLEVVRSLGYGKLSPSELASQPAVEPTVSVPEFTAAAAATDFDGELVEQL